MAKGLTRTFLPVALVWVVFLTLPAAAGATDCVGYDSQFRWVGSQPSAAPAIGCAASGNMFAIVEGISGVELFALPEDGSPQFLATIAAVDSVTRVSFRDGHLYAADGPGVAVYDLTDPSHPTPTDELPFGDGRASALAWTTGRLIVARAGVGISVIDCTNPSHLLLERTVPLAPDGAFDVATQGDLVAVAAGDTLYTVDCGTPSNSHILGRLGMPGHVRVVAWAGNYAYVSGVESGMQVVNLTDPAHPVAGALLAYGSLRDIVINGHMLYGSDYRMEIADITNPALPSYRGYCFLPGSMYEPLVYGGQEMAVMGDLLLLADGAAGGQGFQGLSGVPASVIGEWQGGETSTDLAVCGSIAVVARPGPAQTALLDISSPSDLTELPVHLPSATAVAARDPMVYLVSATGDLNIIDLTDPSTPANDATLPLGVTPQSCALSGNTLYVAAGAGGIVPVNVANPHAPSALPAIATADLAKRVDVEYGIAYVADGAAGLTTIDVHNPGSPTLLRSVATPGDANGVAYVNGRVYVTAGEGGICEFNVMDPAHPLLSNTNQAATAFLDVATASGMLYIADQKLGLLVADGRWQDSGHIDGQVWDIYSNPVRVRATQDVVLLLNGSGHLYSAWRSCSTTTGNQVSGFEATVTSGSTSLTWRSSGEPGDFRLVAHAGQREWEVAIQSLGDGRYGATDTAPILAAGGTVTYTLSWRPAGGVWQVVATREVGLPSPRTSLLAPYPNPFNPQVTVAFTLDHPQQARLTVHDLAGRLVVWLADGIFPAGLTERIWNGQDARGRPMPTGTYFLRLQTGDRVLTKRVTMVK